MTCTTAWRYVLLQGLQGERPTGVDMARMKTEFLYHYRQRHGLSLFDKLVAFLPRYAAIASPSDGYLISVIKFPDCRLLVN